MNNATRKLPVHMPPIWKDCRSPLIFLTVCAENRRKIFDNNLTHKLLEDIWLSNQSPLSWLVGRYVLMPDHIHLFCAPRYESTSLELWVKYWKGQFSKSWRDSLRESDIIINSNVSKPQGDLFQNNFWDTQMRSQVHYSSQWDYVTQNPVRANLVRNADDWKFRGEIDRLEF